jgi:hypothetical protein
MDDEIGGCCEMNENDGKMRFQLRVEGLRQSKETNPATVVSYGRHDAPWC